MSSKPRLDNGDDDNDDEHIMKLVNGDKYPRCVLTVTDADNVIICLEAVDFFIGLFVYRTLTYVYSRDFRASFLCLALRC